MSNLSIANVPITYENSVWFLSNGNIYKDRENISTLPMQAGVYDVQLVLINKQGCIDSVFYPNFLTSVQNPKATFLFPRTTNNV
jgi:hypothetical protein